MYERAQNGQIENFTGVSHPFQEPIDPEIIVETADRDVEACVDQILDGLADLGVLDETIDYDGFSLTPAEYREIVDDLEDSGHIG
jgi:hypothetical protein